MGVARGKRRRAAPPEGAGPGAVRFRPAGDTALVVEFGEAVDRQLNARVLALRERVAAARLPGVVELVPTFRSLTLHYDPLLTCAARLTRALRSLLSRGGGARQMARHWRVPVCYQGAHAPDLAEVAERSGLAPEAVVSLHASLAYYVYMLGFQPGYPYMGDLPAELVMPRREDPRLRVPPGSVAIATTLTAIYPLESPGGWHLIGATPARIFDAGWRSPALFAPGDTVTFVPIGPREFDTIRAESAAERYRVPCRERAG